jgi:hypothetical protein
MGWTKSFRGCRQGDLAKLRQQYTDPARRVHEARNITERLSQALAATVQQMLRGPGNSTMPTYLCLAFFRVLRRVSIPLQICVESP